jgi:hypothetical protein
MTQAQIVGGVVHWLATDQQAAAYTPGILEFVAVPPGAGVQEGWLYNPASGFSAPPPSPAPPPAPPAALRPIDFIALLESAGSVTDAQLAAFAVDTAPAMVALRFKLQLMPAILPTDPALTAALTALEAAGYITTAGAAAVLAAWPLSA